MITPELNHFFGELEQPFLLLVTFLPIQPTDLVVLTIGIVVAVLRPAEFISSAKHRHTLGDKQGGKKIASLSLAQGIDLGIIGWTFDPVIP